jgi:hypothetical protein
VSQLLITPNTGNCLAAEHGDAILKLVAYVSIAYASLDSTFCVIPTNWICDCSPAHSAAGRGGLFYAQRAPSALMRINFTTTQHAALWRVLARHQKAAQ